MNTIEQLVEALKEAKKSIPSTYFVNGNRTEWLIDKAIAAGEAELKRRQDAIAAVEFWISCSTDKQDAYRALLKLLTEETK